MALTEGGGTYYIQVYAIDDEANWDKATSAYAITDAEHYIEVALERETGNGNNDGILRLWIDGSLKETISTVDNWTIFGYHPSFWQFGVVWTPSVDTSGTFYLDELKANDDGSEIGALGGSDAGPEFTSTGLLLAMMGSLGVYFFLQRNWRLAEGKENLNA